jgi:predicted Zn-dependent protease
LAPPDSHYLNAASGWLDLGNPREAAAELASISPACREHPVVLELQWRILAEQKKWDEALRVGRRLVELAPEQPGGWIDQSYALHELKRTGEAQDVLLGVAGRFAHLSIVAYNLACYACQLGDREQARRWLAKAVKVKGKKEIKRLALDDQDLEPMWPEIGEW